MQMTISYGKNYYLDLRTKMTIQKYNDFLYKTTQDLIPTVLFIIIWGCFGASIFFFGLSIKLFAETL